MNLLGFVAMMIFGVAFHVVPRFTGRPLHSARLAGAQWWLSNAGLSLMASGFAIRPVGHPAAAAVLGTGALLGAFGAYAFISNIWRTLGANPLPRAAVRPTGTPLPTVPQL